MPEQFFGVVANTRIYPNKVDIGASFSYQMQAVVGLYLDQRNRQVDRRHGSA